jgi:nidogen (entactin)
MDGTHRKVLVSKDLGVPNGLFFDQRRQEVCWGDVKTKRIECIQKDGLGRRVVTLVNTMHPFDLTESGSSIFWTDWTRKDIPNVDKDGVQGKALTGSIGGNGRLYGISAIKNICNQGLKFISIINFKFEKRLFN